MELFTSPVTISEIKNYGFMRYCHTDGFNDEIAVITFDSFKEYCDEVGWPYEDMEFSLEDVKVGESVHDKTTWYFTRLW
jgi:hypothetical protein